MLPARTDIENPQAQCHILGDEIGTVLEHSSCNGQNCGEFEGHPATIASVRMRRKSQQDHLRTE
jgi:hypothetical protein